MRRLRVIARVLTAALVALGFRLVLTGLTVAAAVTTAGIAGLLLAVMSLSHRGRRVAPHSRLRGSAPGDKRG